MKRIVIATATLLLPLLTFALIPLLWPTARAADDALDERQIYIVALEAAPLALYGGQLGDFAATSPEVLGRAKLNVASPGAIAYQTYLASEQDRFLAAAAGVTGRSLNPIYHYQITFNGLALELTPAEAERLAAQTDAAQIVLSAAAQPLSDAGPRFIGAPPVWDGGATGNPNEGEGMVVGIFDTGIDYGHPSFADVGPIDGHDHVNPRGQFYGYCLQTNPALCNDKLIGIYDFSGDGVTPTDWRVDHGTFVAHIAAGNYMTHTIAAPLGSEILNVSGTAPHANIISYDVCAANACYSHMILAAAEQAAIDQVDVMNYSIGHIPYSPWLNPITQSFLGLRAAGVFVAAAAGNDGPAPATINQGADAPWLLSVGMSTVDRSMATWVENMSGGDTTPPADMRGEAISPAYGPAPIVHARDYDGISPGGTGDGECRTPFPANTFSNVDGSGMPAIVVCENGGVGGVAKSDNVLAGDAGGIVLGRPSQLQYGGLFGYSLPGMRLQADDFAALGVWLASGSGHTATISGSSRSYDVENGDHVISDSSRGPNPSEPDVMRPDVMAPGFFVISALEPSIYGFGTGTSFSSPYAAGAALLIQHEHPDWSVAQIQSAIMSTAVYTAATKEDWLTPADPFDMGSGRVYVANAINAGLLFDESAANFQLADPSRNGDPASLNIASLTQNNCVRNCAWARTVTNALTTSGSWTAHIEAPAGITITVSPISFTLAPGASQTFTVSVDATNGMEGSWAYGRLIWTESSDNAPDQHLPLAVRPAGEDLPDSVNLDIRRNQGSATLQNLVTGDVSTFTLAVQGLTQSVQTEIVLAPDPTPNDPFDNYNDGTTTFFTVTVPAGSTAFIAEIIASESTDIDIYVGLDDGDGLPIAGELACSSTQTSWVEACRLAEPTAGTYWVLLQSFAGSGNIDDAVQIATVVLPAGDNGLLVPSGPASLTAGVPFSLGLQWDLTASPGELWYGRLLLGDGSEPDGVAAIWLNLVRYPDAVSKTANETNVGIGDTVSFTIAIEPNVRWRDLTYTVTDTLPLGLQFVNGTVTNGATTAGHTLTWQGNLPAGDGLGTLIQYQAEVTRDVCLFGVDTLLLTNNVWHEVDDPVSQLMLTGTTVTVDNLNSGCTMVFHRFLPVLRGR